MTVSYPCQKPIKFWAKCKINLLYKLNQSLLCVPGCPLLLATALGTWSHFSCPPPQTSLCVDSEIPPLSSLPPALVAAIGLLPPSPASSPPVYLPCFTNHETSSTCFSWVYCGARPLPPRNQPEHLCAALPAVFLKLFWLTSEKYPLPFPPLRVYVLHNMFCASISVSVKWK